MTVELLALAPGATIGVLGGGQLGRMLALAAARLGLRCHVYAPPGDNPAFDVAAAHTAAAYDDGAALDRFAAAVDVVTYEFENIPVAVLDRLGGQVRVAPGRKALQITQDRLSEKQFLAGLGIAVAPFAPVSGPDEEALAHIGTPAVLKTRRFGYDGKGQVRIATLKEAKAALAAMAGQPAILERHIAFDREVSVVAARSGDGAIAVYDIAENRHADQILRSSRVPANLDSVLAAEAREIARRIAIGLEYVGVLAVELFLAGATLIVNEIAPRVHNSGHWTLDACATSQFEQHIRAIAGWPLGDPSRHSDAVMVNLLGEEVAAWRSLAGEPGTCVHIYGKADARPGRKMGHVTRLEPLSRAAGAPAASPRPVND
jgi:5-(carboxyamino)imidazole ribonucleotide synthase